LGTRRRGAAGVWRHGNLTPANCQVLLVSLLAKGAPATTFVDAIDVVYDSTIPYDLRFFQSLDRVVQVEPWLARDKLMIEILKSIGIEKGKPFNPDAKTQDILTSAAREAHALLEGRATIKPGCTD
jgi:hypothetical protein